MTSWEDIDPVAIAFLFVACARMGDEELHDAELVRLVERVGQWMPGVTQAQLREVLAQAVSLYREAPDRRACEALVHATAERLRDALAREDRERLVTELIGLVYADGTVNVGETDFVMDIARILDVTVAISD